MKQKKSNSPIKFLKEQSEQLPDSIVYLACGTAVVSFMIAFTKPLIQITADFLEGEHKRIEEEGGPSIINL
jgi:hypothetical protein